MGKTGVINRDFTGEENNVYHDVIWLFKIYRAVNWRNFAGKFPVKSGL